MTKETNGPAFPQAYLTCEPHMVGMTLRDYFAAKAMQALLTASYDTTTYPGYNKWVSVHAYEIADDMLEARK